MQGFGLIFAATLLCFGALLNALVLVHFAVRIAVAYASRSKRRKASALFALASFHR